MISFIANRFYAENYCTLPMKHQWIVTEDQLSVAYHWKVGNEWNYLKATANIESELVQEGSEEEFITEHYWGYNCVNEKCTGVYEVIHPRWQVHQVLSYAVKCSVEQLYGMEFKETLEQPPSSVFLAKGSPVTVMGGSKIVKGTALLV
jgi:hypothetical protein